MKNPPVIIIGAGRSGTNMLRDILIQLPETVSWPCDEINYIWRHGNREAETDRFTVEMADSMTAKFIRDQFEKLRLKNRLKTVIEKTCANSLRVEFVNEIFPDAKFIQIVRDGRDVAVSAAKRWNAKLDLGYLAKKARYVPKSDLFFYASRYFANRVHRVFSKKKRLSTWGPKFTNMHEVFANHPLHLGCAIQWQACVQTSAEDFKKIAPERIFNLRYEEFTSDPIPILQRMAEFVGQELGDRDAAKLTNNVSNKSVGSWQRALDEEDQKAIQIAVGDGLNELGYE